jgi:flagella basal body P-ring formation protein FlgA
MSSALLKVFALSCVALLSLYSSPLAQATPREGWVTSEQLKARVVKLVKTTLRDSEREIAEVKPPPMSAIPVPEGSTLRLQVAGEVRNNTLPVEIRVVRGDTILRRQRSFVKIEYYVTVWVLKETTAPKTILEPDRLQQMKKSSSQVPRDAVLDLAQLEGSVLRRRVEANTPIRASWITAPTLVKRGAQVELIFRKWNFSRGARGSLG